MTHTGVLFKWTNYWNGWQPRWFILEEGILSYFKSEDEVTQGCKGSVSVSACDINVHPTDNLRIDIVIPGEQHICVRAASTTERQVWLVCLGSTKAGLDRGRKPTDSVPDALKTKKSELRLYCDLLMQQVHSIKEVSLSECGPTKLDDSDQNGDTELTTSQLSDMRLNLEEKQKQIETVSSLLSATCDTFIKTLDDLVKITNAAAPSTFTSQPVHVVPTQNVAKLNSRNKSITHSNSN